MENLDTVRPAHCVQVRIRPNEFKIDPTMRSFGVTAGLHHLGEACINSNGESLEVLL